MSWPLTMDLALHDDSVTGTAPGHSGVGDIQLAFLSFMERMPAKQVHEGREDVRMLRMVARMLSRKGKCVVEADGVRKWRFYQISGLRLASFSRACARRT